MDYLLFKNPPKDIVIDLRERERERDRQTDIIQLPSYAP